MSCLNKIKDFRDHMWQKLKFENFDFIDSICAIGVIFSYFLITTNRPAMWFSSITVALEEDTGFEFTNKHVAYVLMINSLSYAIGKFTNGFLVDYIGEYTVTFFCMLGSGILTFFSSICTTWQELVIFTFFNQFLQSATWSCMIKVIYGSFRQDQYAKVIAVLGVGSNAGSFLAKYIVGEYLRIFTWQDTLRLLSIFIFFDCIWFASFAIVFFRKRRSQKSIEDKEQAETQVKRKEIEMKLNNTIELQDVQPVEIETQTDGVNNQNRKVTGEQNQEETDGLKEIPLSTENPNNSEQNQEKEINGETLQIEQTEENLHVSENDPVTINDKIKVCCASYCATLKMFFTDVKFIAMNCAMTAITMAWTVGGFNETMLKDTLGTEDGDLGKFSIASGFFQFGVMLGLASALFYSDSSDNVAPEKRKCLQKWTVVSCFLSVLVAGGQIIWVVWYEDHQCTNVTSCISIYGILTCLIGFFSSYPYYVPPSVMSMGYGKYAGFSAALLDLTGFIPSTGFAYIVGLVTENTKDGDVIIEYSGNWKYVWLTLALSTVGSTLSYLWYNKVDDKDYYEQQNKKQTDINENK